MTNDNHPIQPKQGPFRQRAWQQSLWACAYLAAIVLFWSLRMEYWRITNEAPFSDMADYLATAERFRCCWSLSQSDFWSSYMKPTLPTLGGFLFSLTGEINLPLWRICLGLFTFLAVLGLARELHIATRRHIYSLALILCVALSKSSIFWSYKFATEGLAEAFVYLVCALALLVHRSNDSTVKSLSLGAALMLALFNRPNLLPVVPLVAFASLGRLSLSNRSASLRFKNLLGFGAGCLAIITPLALRSYTLYGTVSLSPTQGPYSFLWELGAVPIRNASGETFTRTAQQLQEEAPSQFRNDYEASRYARSIVSGWISENWRDVYPQLIRNRFFGSVQNREISLSKVPRTQLFTGQTERLLIDKSPLLFALGALGILLLSIKYGGALYVIPATALLPWLFGVLFMGEPRMLEPSLPIILFGVPLLVSLFLRSPAHIARKN